MKHVYVYNDSPLISGNYGSTVIYMRIGTRRSHTVEVAQIS